MNILITEGEDYSQNALKIYSNCSSKLIVGVNSKQDLEQKISDSHVIVLRLKYLLDSDLLNKAKSLKYILTPTTGLDHIDVNSAKRLGIKVISLKGAINFLDSIPSTAEHTWALMLALVRKIVPASEHVSDGGWNRQAFRGRNIFGKNYGILGFGRVGKQVAKYAQAFGCHVGAYDIIDIKNKEVIKFSTPEALFAWSDILSIHIPYETLNENFINESLLRNAKKGLTLINTSRGAVLDEAAVVEALENGSLYGLATDVIRNELESEKRKKSPLLNAKLSDRILITPHIAGATQESMHRTEEYIANAFQVELNKTYVRD